MSSPDIVVAATVSALAEQAAERVVAAAQQAIGENGRFALALAGGSTPKALYTLLASEPYRSQIEWSKVEVFFGDERCVPPDHAESNYRMARESLLSKVPIPGDNVYRMAGEIEPNEAAKQYGLMLKEKFGPGGLDLTLLGLGDDGHTASLFPHTPALKELEHRVVAQFVENSTTGQSWRITFTAPFINRSREVLFLVAGLNKAAAVKAILEGEPNPEKYPAQLIDAAKTSVTWLIDAAAAAMDEEEDEQEV